MTGTNISPRQMGRSGDTRRFRDRRASRTEPEWPTGAAPPAVSLAGDAPTRFPEGVPGLLARFQQVAATSAAQRDRSADGRRSVPAPRQSSLAPDAFTTFAHFSCSALTKAVSSSGLMGLISPPRSAKRFCSSGVSRALRTSWLSFVVMLDGVPFGAKRANQLEASKPGRAASASVGIVRERGRAPGRGDGERPQGPGLGVLDRGGQVVEHHVHLSADEVVDGRSAAPVRHVGHLDARSSA